MGSTGTFTINVADDVLTRIRDRVAAYRWFPAPDMGGPWQFGMAASVLKDIQD